MSGDVPVLFSCSKATLCMLLLFQMALEANLFAASIDICVVSETHLKKLYQIQLLVYQTMPFTGETRTSLTMTSKKREGQQCMPDMTSMLNMC